MAIVLTSNLSYNGNLPLDDRTFFNTLEDALNGLPAAQRFKGQKFVVKNPPLEDSPNGEPKEYIFLEDYQEAGEPSTIWIKEDKNYGIDWESENFDWDYCEENYDDVWDEEKFGEFWKEVCDPPEIIPEPVLYKPGGDGGGDGGIPEAPENDKQYARQNGAWTEVQAGGTFNPEDVFKIATGDRLRAETACKNDASLNRKHEPLYVNDIDRPLTINEYADRQPGAKLYTKHEFGNILRTIKNKEDYKITLPNNTKQQGEIKMSYNVLTLDSKDKTFLHTYPKGKTGDSFTIPNSVTSIGSEAFYGCASLTGVTFATGSNIADADFGNNAFPQGNSGYGGNTLKDAYSTGKAGTYTRAPNGTFSSWTKQP